MSRASVSDARAAPVRRYRAFLSYSHLDNVEDGRRWAEWIQHNLETFDVPRALRRQLGGSGRPLFPVFRDEEELSGASRLSELIDRALEDSEWLIVLCSPRGAGSAWVNEEVRRFIELGRADRIVPILIEGEPGASVRPGMDALRECLPKALRSPQVRTGDLEVAPRRPGASGEDVLAADFRLPGGAQGYTSPAAYRAALERGSESVAPLHDRKELRLREKEHGRRLRLELLRVIATLLGVELADLVRRDVQERLRRTRRALRVAAVVALGVLGLAAFAMWQSARRLQLLEHASRVDSEEAGRAAEQSEFQRAIALLCRALRYWPENQAAAAQLWLLLRHEHGHDMALAERSFDCRRRSEPQTSIEEDGIVRVLKSVNHVLFSPDGRYLAFSEFDRELWLCDLDGDGRIRWFDWPGWSFGALAFRRDSAALVIAGAEPAWRTIDLPAMEERAETGNRGRSLLSMDGFDGFSPLSPDAARCAMVPAADGSVSVVELETGRAIPLRGPGLPVVGSSWSGNGRRIGLARNDGQLEIYDVQDASRCITIGGTRPIQVLALDETGERFAMAVGVESADQWSVHEAIESSNTCLASEDLWWLEFVPWSDEVLYRTSEGSTLIRACAEEASRSNDLRQREVQRVFFARGNRIAVLASGNRVSLWRGDESTPATPWQTLAGARTVEAISADGRRIATLDGDEASMQVWRIDARADETSEPEEDLAWDFGAKRPSGDWEAATLSLVGGSLVAHPGRDDQFRLNWNRTNCTRVAWSRDGRTLWLRLPGGKATGWTWDPPSRASDGIREWATRLGGLRLSDEGVLEEISFDEVLRWRDMSAISLAEDGGWRSTFDWLRAGRE